MDWIVTLDNRILTFVADNLHNPFLDFLMPIITSLGNVGIFWILLGILLLFFPKWRHCGFQMLVAMALTVLIGNVILKPLVDRVRPFEANGFLELLIKAPTDASFPSGHTGASFASAAVLFMWNKRFGIPALVLAALIAFSRIYLYVHYPSDVFAGLVLGGSMAILTVFAAKWIRRKKKNE